MGLSPDVSVMRSPTILSVTPSTTPSPQGKARTVPAVPKPRGIARPPSDESQFDACQVGLVLRAVLAVEAVLAVVAMFMTSTPDAWLALIAVATGGTLPATLLWLVCTCAAKKPLSRLPRRAQYAAGALLGALSALYGCGLLRVTGVVATAPWLASAVAGAMFASVLMAGMVLRARGRTPAATTARLTELQSRIRPHFLFNTLNSAIALVRAEPAQAESLLEDLSDLFRHALVEQGETVTLAQEIELARHYLHIEQVRFGERLRVQWQIDPRAGGALLPPLLLQPLVENAVKHGVEPCAQGGKLRVLTELRGSRVLVRITNTLPGSDDNHDNNSDSKTAAQASTPPRGHGIALANVRARLSLLHDLQSDFSAGVVDGLYQVRIVLPAPDPNPSKTRNAP